jgi:hypothetical protein
MRRLAYLVLLVVQVLLSSSARAELLITVESKMIQSGQEGDVNVWISSNSGESLNNFGVEFRITTGGATRLEFVDPQPDSQLTNPSYVFHDNSGDLNTPLPVGLVSTTTTPNDTFIGGDFTFDGSDVQVTSSPLLLATLRVTSSTALPPAPGNTFTISLIDSLNTFFVSSTDSLQYSSTAGTVTVVASVPEPSSFIIAAAACGGMLLSRAARSQRRSRRWR